MRDGWEMGDQPLAKRTDAHIFTPKNVSDAAANHPKLFFYRCLSTLSVWLLSFLHSISVYIISQYAFSIGTFSIGLPSLLACLIYSNVGARAHILCTALQCAHHQISKRRSAERIDLNSERGCNFQLRASFLRSDFSDFSKKNDSLDVCGSVWQHCHNTVATRSSLTGRNVEELIFTLGNMDLLRFNEFGDRL